MGTHAYIYVKNDKKDFGNKVVFNHKTLPNGMALKKIRKVPNLKIIAPYMGVYCHYDGYPEFVGVILAKYYTTKEQALNLICGGNMSTIHVDIDISSFYKEHKQMYGYIRNGVDYHRQSTIYGPNNLSYYYSNTQPQGQYVYIFQNGEWYFRNSEQGKMQKLIPYLQKHNLL
jgi:hypothetical protein